MAVGKNDVLYALLALDAYNRGYGAGISDGENLDAEGVEFDGLRFAARLFAFTASQRFCDIVRAQ